MRHAYVHDRCPWQTLAMLGVAVVSSMGGCANDDRTDGVGVWSPRQLVGATLRKTWAPSPAEELADVRPEMRDLVAAAQRGGWQAVLALQQSRGDMSWLAGSVLPTTVRVWYRCTPGDDACFEKPPKTDLSCSQTVVQVPLEDYVRGVLPFEMYTSWKPETLKAGAVAARTFVAFHAYSGGRYACADVCNTIWSQMYKDAHYASTDAAVAATSGQVRVSGTIPVLTEYSAENGNPTADGISDPLCDGQTVNGHGRGLCQNGAQRWGKDGKDYQWILDHYYPGSTTYGGGTSPPPCVPTGPEVCGDGIDNDCNNQIDEGCSTSPPTCVPTGPEICDGIDNDCKNGVDDGDPGGGAYCTISGQQGPCATGITRCQSGHLACVSTYTPKAETCNKVDDDCNGRIDDVPGGCGATCTPQPEICNGLDDDCDGIPDNGNPQGGQVCYPGAGSCPVGVTVCENGHIVCRPQAQPEVCDGKDNDCNGYVDDVPGGCGGTTGCVPSGPEICDKKDNDCNGYTDDVNGGCSPGCVPSGIEICDGRDNDCNGFVDDVIGGCGSSGCIPTGTELCDGRDNDCNGIIDDVIGGCVPSCIPSGPEICDGRDNDCNGLSDDVPGGCGGPTIPGCTPQPERCNNADDDCDGFPDEGNPDGGDGCTVYTASLPFSGVMLCVSGQLVCQVNDPGTSSFTGALRPIRGAAGCQAAPGDAGRATPLLTLLLLGVAGWWRRRRRARA